MKDFGFVRVAAVTPRVWLANPGKNVEEINRLTGEALRKGASVIVFPELCVTGYSCADLFGQELLLSAAQDAVAGIASASLVRTASVEEKGFPLIVIGAPVRFCGRLYNCAIVIGNGKIFGIVPKTYLPNSAEFYEMRWFESGDNLLEPEPITYAGQQTRIGIRQLFKKGLATIGVEVCQDLWVPIPPCSYAAVAGANLILNLSASNEALCKQDYRKLLIGSTSARLSAAYVYCSCGYGESTTDLVWGGSSLIYENGTLLAENERFKSESSIIYADADMAKMESLRSRNPNFCDSYSNARFEVADTGEFVCTNFENEFFRTVDELPFVPGGNPAELDKRCREILEIQTMGLRTRLEHIHANTAVIGISGGLDSTLALLVTVHAFDSLGWDRSRITGVTMPGFGTTPRTKSNADTLMGILGITRKEISIVPSVSTHLKDIGHPLDKQDLTYENAQARERMQILMDVAGEEGGLVVGTGDLSELALGWCTYNADHMSMYGVNASVPKTLVRTLVRWASEEYFSEAEDVLKDIIDTPISPELLPAAKDGSIQQVTEDIVGPYELHDFFLYQVMRWGYEPEKVFFLARKAFKGRYSDETLKKWLHNFYSRFFAQQFKRSCLPDGPKVGSVSLSPRGDWRMPSDAQSELWKKVMIK